MNMPKDMLQSQIASKIAPRKRVNKLEHKQNIRNEMLESEANSFVFHKLNGHNGRQFKFFSDIQKMVLCFHIRYSIAISKSLVDSLGYFFSLVLTLFKMRTYF